MFGVGLALAKRRVHWSTASGTPSSMIPSLQQLLLVFTAYAIAAGSPGPSNMQIMAVAMHQGRQAALTFAAGVVTGSIFWGLMAATGVSALLTRYAQALVVLKIFGGLYLLFLAIKAGRAALTPDETAAKSAPHEAGFSRITLYRRGLLMHLSNPKAILAWIALLTLGLGSNASPQSVVVILGGCFVLSVTIFCGYAWVFSTAPMVRLYRGARRWIEGVLAGLFAFAGLRLLLSRL
jgi:threonine/homoserine/homoserine lactone efflux protein